MMLDVTDIPDICRGDIVTFIGQSGAESISPSEMARNAGISVNELICRLPLGWTGFIWNKRRARRGL